jgi:hypothetical protein
MIAISECPFVFSDDIRPERLTRHNSTKVVGAQVLVIRQPKGPETVGFTYN